MASRRSIPRFWPVFLALAPLVSSFPAPAAERGGSTLHVFAAASLADAFGEIAEMFERSHPGTSVQLNLAGTQQLAVQIEHGARADVFAAADEGWMGYARDRSLLDREPAAFARNRLVMIVPRANPAGIEDLEHLSRRGVKVVIGAEAVPVGRYARDMLRKLSRAAGFDSGYARRVLANVVSEEENVKSIVGKVRLGEADAGIVYQSDATPTLTRFVRVFPIPDSANALAVYPIAVVRDAASPRAAREFVALVLSPAGQRALRRRGLIPIRDVAP